MIKKEPQQRIRDIYQMLFEIATGNLSYRMQEVQHRDGLDVLVENLNQFAAQMQAALLRNGYVSPKYTYQNLVQLSLILDEKQIVINCTKDSDEVIGHPAHRLIGTNFTNILAEQSVEYFKLITKPSATANSNSTANLIFKSPHNELLPRSCTIHKLHDGNIIINSISTILQDLLYDLQQLKQTHTPKPKPSEAETMQQLYDYILSNLDNPLPTLKQLSKLFRINEYDLKNGFRTFFHTSIHHFYNEERLKRAHVMISNTTISLKTVAVANGFTNYTSFYKAFKKRFGYAPSDLKRDNSTDHQPLTNG